MRDVNDVRTFFARCFESGDTNVEALFVAHLDGRFHCFHVSRHKGDACSANFPLREIVSQAIALGTTGLLLAHNHPSGDSQPSPSDCHATRRLAAVAEAIDCSIADHLVFGGGGCTSFRQLGLL